MDATCFSGRTFRATLLSEKMLTAYRHESSDWSLARFTRLAKLHDQSTSAGYLVTSARVNPSHAVEILIAVCRLQLRRQVAQLIIC